MGKEGNGTNPLEFTRAVGLLLIEGIGANVANLMMRTANESKSRYRKPFDASRIAHNLWVRATTSKEDREQTEETLDLATIGAIDLPREEYEKLSKRTFK